MSNLLKILRENLNSSFKEDQRPKVNSDQEFTSMIYWYSIYL